MVTMLSRLLGSHRRGLRTEAPTNLTVQRDRSRSRSLSVTLASMLMATLTLSLVPSAALADEWTYEKAFNDSELWTSQDPTSDWTANPKKYSKKGKEKFRTSWDLALADMTGTRIVRTEVEDGVRYEFDLYMDQWRSNTKSKGKRTAQVLGVLIYGEDASPVLGVSADASSEGGDVPYRSVEAQWQAPHQRPSGMTWSCNSSVQDRENRVMMLDLHSDCLPSSVSTITRVDFISQVRVYNKKGKYRVKAYDRNVMDGLSITIR